MDARKRQFPANIPMFIVSTELKFGLLLLHTPLPCSDSSSPLPPILRCHASTAFYSSSVRRDLHSASPILLNLFSSHLLFPYLIRSRARSAWLYLCLSAPKRGTYGVPMPPLSPHSTTTKLAQHKVTVRPYAPLVDLCAYVS